MKTTSVLALATALALCAPSFAYAQAASATGAATGAASTATDATAEAAGTNAAGSAGANINLDTNNDGTVSADEQAAGNAASSTTLTVDANADGTVSADEIAAADAAIGGGTSIDVNGDGTLSDEELTNANTQLASLGNAADTVACSENGIEATIAGMGSLDMAALMAATNVRIVTVGDCDADDVTSALATEGATQVRKSLEGNAAAVAAIQARGASVANVLGATTADGMLTIYVADVQG